MSEAQEQAAVVDYCDIKNIPAFHVPNGGRRSPKEAAHLKRQGVKPGVPDLCIPVARGGFHGLWIEMKYGRNTVSDSQKAWIRLLRGNGYAAYVCYGADSAIECIDAYMAL